MLGTFFDRWYFGPPSHICSECDAIVWFEERIQRLGKVAPKFAICCLNGKVKIPYLCDTPPLLATLLDGNNDICKEYRRNIRHYNNMFGFTSMGAKLDSSVNDGGGPYCYRIHGEVYHKIGALLPEHGKQPLFAQLYIYDTENEIDNRVKAFCPNSKETSPNKELICVLQDMLDEVNPYVRKFRQVRDWTRIEGHKTLQLQIVESRDTDGIQYSRPSASEVAVLMMGNIDQQSSCCD